MASVVPMNPQSIIRGTSKGPQGQNSGEPNTDAHALWAALRAKVAPATAYKMAVASRDKHAMTLATLSAFRNTLRQETNNVRKASTGDAPALKTTSQVEDERRRSLSTAPAKWKGLEAGLKKSQQDNRTYKYILSPLSPFRLVWDTLQLGLLVYICIMLPLRVGFDLTPGSGTAFIEYCIDGLFVADVVINFFTAYYSEENHAMVRNPKRIAVNYLRTWFVIDAISSIPDVVFFGSAAAKTLKVGRILKPFRLIRLSRLLRLFRTRALLERMEDLLAFNHGMLAMMKLPAVVLLFLHLSACTFFFVGSLERLGEGWVDLFNVRDADFSTQYNVAFYWVVSSATTVGYGDVSPVTNAERTVAIVVMLVGGGLFGYTITILGVTVAKINAHGALITEKMDILKAYGRKTNLPKGLAQRMRAYYRHYFASRTAFNEREILAQLSTTLRHEVAVTLLDEAILRQALLKDVGAEFLSGLYLALRPIRAAKGDLVMEAGELGSEMFFVLEGELEVLSPDNHPLYVIRAGGSIGEAEVLHPDTCIARMVNVRALEDCKLASLTRVDFEKLVEESPDELTTIRENATRMYSQWRMLLTGKTKSMSSEGFRVHQSFYGLHCIPSDDEEDDDCDTPGGVSQAFATPRRQASVETYSGDSYDARVHMLERMGDRVGSARNVGVANMVTLKNELDEIKEMLGRLSNTTSMPRRRGSTRSLTPDDPDDLPNHALSQTYETLLTDVYRRRSVTSLRRGSA